MFGGERAQSEVLGTVLLLGLTVTVVGSTVALGGAALDDAQTRADLQRAEGAMTQLDSKTSLVAHGESPSQRLRMDVGRTADFRVNEDAGWMRIEVETAETEVNETVTLGAVVYERDGETVAYQGGGVWRSGGGGARMVSPPEFHYRGDTLTLPLVTVGGDGRVGDAVVVSRVQERPTGLFPTEDVANPLLGGNVTITIQSDYAAAWKRFFESRTTADVTTLNDSRIAVTLRTTTIHPTLSSSISATGRSSLDVGGIERLHADSYDSSAGTYEDQDPDDGATIQTRDEFRLTADGGGNTDSITVRGDLSAESYNIPPGQEDKLNVTGERRTETAFDDLAPVEGEITRRIADVTALDLANEGASESSIDLSGTATKTIDEDTYVEGDVAVSESAVLTVADGATLHAAGGMDIDGDGRVNFDAAGGDVQTLIEGSVDLSGDAAIRASGDGRVDLYVDDTLDLQDAASVTTATRFEMHTTDEIELDDGVNITADGDVTSNLWLYSSGDEVEIEGDGNGDDDRIRFTGVFYAPQSNAELEDRMTIKGSFTFRNFEFDDGDITVHYDESLQTVRPFGGDSVPVVSHLYVSTHGVVVSEG